MTINPALFTSTRTGTGSDTWTTPRALFALLDAEFCFGVDAAADPGNHLCDVWYGPGGVKEDALTAVWSSPEPIWLNPPYSKLREFMAQAAHMAKNGSAPIVCLIPARTDTRAWFDYVIQATEIRFLKGRLKFGGAASAPFPSAVVIFDEGNRSGDEPRVVWWDWKKDLDES